MDQLPKDSKKEQVPAIEIERKYLLALEDDLKNLEKKLRRVFPGVRFVEGFSEISYYFPRMDKVRAKVLLGIVMKYREEEGPALLERLNKIPESTPIAIRLRRRKNQDNKTFILSFKASANPLHDPERIEIETSDTSENYLEGFEANGIKPESIWHSNRRIYAMDDGTKIDVQDVTGYGYTAEIESSDLKKVESVAQKLGLEPVSSKLLDAMYKKYKNGWQQYYNETGNIRHFTGDDWKEIESLSGETAIKNSIQ